MEWLPKKDGVTAVWREIDEFGYGATMSDALYDLSRTLDELYFSLSDEAKSGSDLQKIKVKLSQHIGVRSS